eukprot:TRINITY_DN318_c3_g1_i2.p1 TRINITY_DN318_c3_g1~~TRINITY_DN318_c3_g1_i2.p1  ORF type:complete len:513 (-),score=112.14 TRINITY_DN318_c3_g1_i2:20-1558(-)
MKYSTRENKNFLKSHGYKPLDIEPPTSIIPIQNVELPTLSHGLDEVLFSPGVHFMKDRDLYKFPSYLRRIHQPSEVDFSLFSKFVSSSQDERLHALALDHGCKYKGSTSSMTGALSQLYYLFSNGKTSNVSCLPSFRKSKRLETYFTPSALKPVTIVLRKRDNIYSVDSGKSQNIVDNHILMDLGRSLEVLLTTDEHTFEKTFVKNSQQQQEKQQQEKKNIIAKAEGYNYTKFGSLLLRSQIDCHHADLPRSYFDLKTRATHAIRLHLENYQEYLEKSTITKIIGQVMSYEREFYDMVRGAFLKYIFQVRIGRMDGVFVAYHNTNHIFGYEYLSLDEMEKPIFETKKMANTSFHVGISLFETVCDRITNLFPKETLKITFHTRIGKDPVTSIFVERVPVDKDEGFKTYEYKEDKNNNNRSNNGNKNSRDNHIDEDEDDEDDDDDITQPGFTLYDVHLFELRLKTVVNGVATFGPLLLQEDDDVKVYYLLEEKKRADTELRYIKVLREQSSYR